MKYLLVALLPLLVISCKKDKPAPEYIFMDMMDSPATIPGRPNRLFRYENSLLMPPEGSLQQNYIPFPTEGNADDIAAKLVNPVPRTMEYMKRGKVVFETFCMECHGEKAEGDGTILNRDGHSTGFPRPPTLHSKKIRKWSDGRIYYVIMNGQNNVMPSYAARIPEVDRWSVIHYLRALDKSEYASKEDKEKVDNGKF